MISPRAQEEDYPYKKSIKKGTGIKIISATKHIAEQEAEGQLPFENIPEAASDVQIFKDIQAPLISVGKMPVKECKNQ